MATWSGGSVMIIIWPAPVISGVNCSISGLDGTIKPRVEVNRFGSLKTAIISS
jgi:hypothetical protein